MSTVPLIWSVYYIHIACTLEYIYILHICKAYRWNGYAKINLIMILPSTQMLPQKWNVV